MTAVHVDPELTALLNQALPLWAQVTQTPLGPQTQHTLGTSWLNDSFVLTRALADLNASRVADPSGWTTLLLLRGWVEQMLDDATVRLRDVVTGDLPGLAAVTQLVQLVQSPVAQAAIDQVVAESSVATAGFGVDSVATYAVLTDWLSLGEVRLNALRSLDQLRVHQLCRGTRTMRRLQLNTHVHRFPSVGHFAAALAASEDSAATLAVIYDDRDPDTTKHEPHQAHFAIGMRDGDVLSVVTDLQDEPSPNYRARTRRPERAQASRAQLHHLPYWLLEPDADNLQIQVYGRPQWPIHALHVHEVIWLLMVVEQLSDRIEHGDLEQAELSYAGTLVGLTSQPGSAPEIQSVLRTQRAPRALTLIHQQGQVELPTLRVAEVTPEAADALPQVGHTAWLVERYLPQVPPGTVDVVHAEHVRRAGQALIAALITALPAPSADAATEDDATTEDDEDGQGDTSHAIAKPEMVSAAHWRWKVRHGERRHNMFSLRALSPDYLAHRSEVARDAAWLARHNLAQVIQTLARDEFERSRDTIIEWYVASASANLAVLAAVARQTWMLPVARYRSDLPCADPGHESFPSLDELIWLEQDVLRSYVRTGRARYERVGSDASRRPLSSGYRVLMQDATQARGADGDLLCKHCVDHHHRTRPRVASTVTEIYVDNYRAIAQVTGSTVMPWALQHYVHSKPYTQNSILQRVDPVDEIDDPWSPLDLRVVVALCRPCLNELRKVHDLPSLPASPRREVGRLRRSKPASP